jgi:macrocin-O-methyltransferase TylF-like protien
MTPSSDDAPHTITNTSPAEREQRAALMLLLRETPIPDAELDANLGVYLTRQTLSRMLYMHDLYRQIVDVPGVIMEFGVRWGQNMSLFASLRGIYEPYNYSRRLVGFDTFDGFPSVSAQDGAVVAERDYSVTPDYASHLTRVLEIQESLSPVAQIPKFELVIGDATETLPTYLGTNPQTIVALAYFDLDLYAPTKSCLDLILPRIPKGGIIAFDELNHPAFPGETAAVMEAIGLHRYRLVRSPLHTFGCYMKVEESSDEG